MLRGDLICSHGIDIKSQIIENSINSNRDNFDSRRFIRLFGTSAAIRKICRSYERSIRLATFNVNVLGRKVEIRRGNEQRSNGIV